LPEVSNSGTEGGGLARADPRCSGGEKEKVRRREGRGRRKHVIEGSGAKKKRPRKKEELTVRCILCRGGGDENKEKGGW